MHKRTYVIFLLLWLWGCTPAAESPSGQTAATPAPTSTVSATATLAPWPSPTARPTLIPATVTVPAVIPTPAATPTTAANAAEDRPWCLGAPTDTVASVPWGSHPGTLFAAELRDYLVQMGVTGLCLPPEVGAPYLGVDWNVAAIPPTADSGRRLRIDFKGSGTVSLIYATYDFALGTEYITHATIADYEVVQAGTHPDLITTNGTPGFLHIGSDGYTGVIKAFVYPFADHYVALSAGLSYEAGVGDLDALAAAMAEPPYPAEGAAALQALDEMVASLMLTAGIPTESAESAETGPRTEEIESWSSTSPDGQWVAQGQWLAVYEEGEGGGDILAAYQRRLTVENTTTGTSWPVVDEVEPGVGMGYQLPEVLQWSSRQPTVYVTHRARPEGCGSPFINGSGLLRVDLRTGQVAELLSPSTYVLALSPGGTKAITADYGDTPGLVFHDLATGETRHLPLDVTYGEVGGFVWSPDGRQLLLARATTPPTCEANYDIVLVNVESLALTTIIQDDERGLIPAEWAVPDTPVLQGRDGQRWQLHLDSGQLEPVASE